ncbi:vanadium-dependent nitrogenase transcriptional regulator VnfA2 [Azotobacter vinelandii]|nr:vanadium-dependent nitrogenase transcriptional regulator VnfA2 [Azotobacter vinelandii]WKN20391.1 sigma 54-interacting transcriptional regulator [Azotobacter vinelandii]GLK61673.1 sigma-54-dependent Fis family transcriptional regulator [Azotobacter vinelandii]SFY23748.1 Nif-specific regulatory protein [Azotobacter vinelandii]
MRNKPCEWDMGECHTDLLPLLGELGRIPSEGSDLAGILRVLLELMQRHLKMARGMVTLRDPESGRIFVQQGCGLSEEEEASGYLALGEDIVAQAVDSGRTVVLPGEAGNQSLLCVPIRRDRKVLGTIVAERHYANRRMLELDAEILAILAALTAQAVELHLQEHVRKVALEDENHRLHSALQSRFKPSSIIGSSRPLQEVHRLIEKVARSRATVLILGESGVGKELVASAIHYNGSNAEGPFVKFNCAALPESVIESELFGHEYGAFTGAATPRRGRFEAADGGTIFLDEVGELSPAMQAKLLRVLQEKSFERVGGNVTHQVDLRILAATSRDLRAMVEQSRFRGDLYYRLNVFPISVPPLRERDSDIAILAEHFVARLSSRMGIPAKRISTPAMGMLMCYHWPGNVRELENVIERAVLLCEGAVIEPHHLPPSLQTPAVSESPSAGGILDVRLGQAECELIAEALKRHKGNMTESAAHLGLTRRVLGLRMARHNLNHKEFR